MTRPLPAALRFLLAGALLFALARTTAPAPAVVPGDARGDDDLLAAAALAHGLDRDDAVIQRRLMRNMAFLDGAADDSPADAARRLGLAGSDLVVRRRLAQRMRRTLEAEARAVEPSDAELEAYLVAHPERFGLPARASVTQVFLSRRRGATLAEDARQLRAELAGGAPAARGDALPLPAALTRATAAQLSAWLGPAVAAAAFTAPLGAWSDPVESAYGLHLLRVDERLPPERPALATTRAALREAWLAARGEAAVETALRAWRAAAVP